MYLTEREGNAFAPQWYCYAIVYIRLIKISFPAFDVQKAEPTTCWFSQRSKEWRISNFCCCVWHKGPIPCRPYTRGFPNKGFISSQIFAEFLS